MRCVNRLISRELRVSSITIVWCGVHSEAASQTCHMVSNCVIQLGTHVLQVFLWACATFTLLHLLHLCSPTISAASVKVCNQTHGRRTETAVAGRAPFADAKAELGKLTAKGTAMGSASLYPICAMFSCYCYCVFLTGPQ